MFENLKSGWQLGSQTRKLIFRDKDLLLYPVLSFILVAVEAILIFAVTFLIIIPTKLVLLYIPALFVFYVVVTYTSTYIGMALLIAFRSFANGKKIGMGEAFNQVSSYSKLILEWSLFYAVVLMILRAIESRVGGIGRMLIGSIGSIALSAATIFVLPIILDDKTGPIATIKKSVQMLASNFGSTFGGIAYSDLYGVAIALIGFAILILGVVIGVALVAPSIIIPFGIVFVAFLVGAALITHTTSTVFRLILYDYVKTGKLPEGYSKDMIEKSIKRKRNPII